LACSFHTVEHSIQRFRIFQKSLKKSWAPEGAALKYLNIELF
jgi:hypothetical protein